MYMKCFGINIDKSKKLWGIIFIAVFVAIILILLSFMLIFNDSYDKGINKISDLFSATSYYTECNVKIISNKNENEYKIKEWYVKNEEGYNFRLETNNGKSDFIYFGNQNSICVKSNEQISSLDLSEYNLKRNNLLSISSIMDFLYKVSISSEDYNNKFKCCKIEEVVENQNIMFRILFNTKNIEKNECELCSKFFADKMKISKIEIVLDKEKIIPKQYIIYDINNKIYISVVYNKFFVNEIFDKKLFAI